MKWYMVWKDGEEKRRVLLSESMAAQMRRDGYRVEAC